jgi:hypothetical protein
MSSEHGFALEAVRCFLALSSLPSSFCAFVLSLLNSGAERCLIYKGAKQTKDLR